MPIHELDLEDLEWQRGSDDLRAQVELPDDAVLFAAEFAHGTVAVMRVPSDPCAFAVILTTSNKVARLPRALADHLFKVVSAQVLH